MLHTSLRSGEPSSPTHLTSCSTLGTAVSHRGSSLTAPTAKDRHQDLAFICLLKQTDLICSSFYYDISNSYSVLTTRKRFNFIAVSQTVTLNLTRVSKQRLFDINRWEARTMGLSNSQDKLYLPSPTFT